MRLTESPPWERPDTRRSEFLACRFDVIQATELKRYAEHRSITLSDAIRELIRNGLNQKGGTS